MSKQQTIVYLYFRDHLVMTPAFISNQRFGGVKYPAELARVCRKLRSNGELLSFRGEDPKFVSFRLSKQGKLTLKQLVKDLTKK